MEAKSESAHAHAVRSRSHMYTGLGRASGRQMNNDYHPACQPWARQASTLDTRATVPTPAGGGLRAARGAAPCPPDAEEGRGEPADGGQECEGLICLP